jgi:Tol biopolymer transport system component
LNFRRVQVQPVVLKKRWVSVAALVVLAVTLSCNLASRLSSQQSQFQGTDGPLGLIAYVGTDGNIYTINRDGKQQTAITQDANLSPAPGQVGHYYTYPTWAPNGYRLAFMSFAGSTQANSMASLYTISSDGKKRVEVFNSQNSFPFYLFWSPNSKYVTFLSNSPGGSQLDLNFAAAEGGDSKVIGTGQPFYWDWSPDNRAIITHTGGAATDNPDAGLAFYQLDGSIQRAALDLKPGPFQAPAWSPAGDELLLAAENATGGAELILAGRDGTIKHVLAQLNNGQASFAWSPKGNLLAYSTPSANDPSGLISRLILLDPAQPKNGKDIMKGILLAFFWSPNSQKIAYFIPSSGNQPGNSQSLDLIQNNFSIKLDVMVYDLSSGETKQVLTFTPTDSFFQVFPYFDQYQRSTTIWSPDSKSLVLAGVDEKEGPSIFVVNVDEDKSQRIAAGSLAFWSWK